MGISSPRSFRTKTVSANVSKAAALVALVSGVRAGSVVIGFYNRKKTTTGYAVCIHHYHAAQRTVIRIHIPTRTDAVASFSFYVSDSGDLRPKDSARCGITRS